MLDIATMTALATSTVSVLAPLLQKAIDKGAEKIGDSAAKMLFDKLNDRLRHRGAKEALEDLAQQPSDVAAQGALNMQLRKALEADVELAAFLKQWGEEAGSKTDVTQTANTYGDNNKTVQITGSSNSVS
ncbi:hypothetical protein [Variovorax sp. PvP013]|uniref:hypothetical protein n=1 Tax=Variovorax sp. PvP013 TaxID=3156435 RepID=UPI003D1CAEFC